MRRFLPFRQTIIFVTLFFLYNGQSQACSLNNRIYECQATSSSSTVDLTNSLPQASEYDSISIKYNGNVVLDLTSPSTKPIVIAPLDSNDHKLQISRINTNASSIQIKILLSSGQVAVSLFTDSSSIIAATATVTVNAAQTSSNADEFKIFAPSSTTTMNFANFELIVNATNSDIGNLYLPNLIFGLTNLISVSISGSNHDLIVDQNAMPQSNFINRLSLKRLRLYNQILFNFKNLTFYSIEQCTFNKTSSLLNATQTAVNMELEMKNNIPTDGILPYRSQAFLALGILTSLTLIEPQLNSTALNAIKYSLRSSTVIISLNSYQRSDVDSLADEKLMVKYLTIKNIATLNVFRDVFFNNFHALKQVTLQGNFVVDKAAIRIFVGINKGLTAEYPIVTLDTTQTPWNTCTWMYITGINIKSISDVPCASDPTCQTCQRWYDDTVSCDLITYEKSYISLITEKLTENYYYYNSTLYYYFQSLSCLNLQSTQPPPAKESVHIGAIIGALCGLIIAAIILGLTVYFICRKRNQYPSENEPSAPQFKKIRSSSDPSNVSIATSKTSKSSRYALEKSFFPAIQPNDEIAPPLYTAPSESVASTSNYRLPSAPAAPRDSISTHATTHFYETVDP